MFNQISVKSVKTPIKGAVRTVVDWSRPHEPRIAGQLDNLVERWKVFEDEMHSVRTGRLSGTPRWDSQNQKPEELAAQNVPPVQTPQVQNEAQFKSASNVQSTAQQVQQRVVPPVVSRPVKPQIAQINEPVANVAEETATEFNETRDELAKYLRTHQKEVEDHRENLRKKLDRIAFQSLPKLQKHMLVNPQKLYTPAKKLNFKNFEKVGTPGKNLPGMKQVDISNETYYRDPALQAQAQGGDVSNPYGYQQTALDDANAKVTSDKGAQTYASNTNIQPPAVNDAGKKAPEVSATPQPYDTNTSYSSPPVSNEANRKVSNEVGAQTYASNTNYSSPALNDTSTKVSADYGTQNQVINTNLQRPAVDPNRRMTRLEALTNPVKRTLPYEPVKPQVRPPTVLEVVTSKPSPTISQAIKEQLQVEPTADPDVTSEPSQSAQEAHARAMSLIEQLQASASEHKGDDQLSPYPVVPYKVRYMLPTPSANTSLQPTNNKKVLKPPMSFESSLTSVERMMEVTLTKLPPNSLRL